MNNLQHERITVLAQDLRVTALPDSMVELRRMLPIRRT